MYLNDNKKAVTEATTYWLTLTWDVFKYSGAGSTDYSSDRLTLTWDVFKFLILISVYL